MTELEQIEQWLNDKHPKRSVNSNKDLQEFSLNDMIEFSEWKEKKRTLF